MSLTTTPTGRSKLENLAFTAVMMVFFFAVGLAGGAYYLLQQPEAGPQVADTNTAPYAEEAQRLAQVQPTARPPDTVPTLPPEMPIAPAFQHAATPSSPAPQPQPVAQAEPAPIPYAATSRAPSAGAKPARKPAADNSKSITSRQVAALRPPAIAATKSAGAYRVQFGAFANEDNARRIQWAIEATGMPVEVTRAANSAGRVLFTLHSPRYPDATAAQAAADVVRDKVGRFVNPLPIDYAVISDTATQ